MIMQSIERPAAPAINYGLRATLGMMLPSVNRIAEPQINAMLPTGVSLHTTRLRLVSDSAMLSMLDRLEEATTLLADAQPDRIIFHCTAVSMYSPEIVGEITARVAAVTSIPLVITSEAVIAALRTLEAAKIVLVTPYVQATNDREVRFLAHHGVDVLRERGLGIENGTGMAAVEPEQWYREVMAQRDTSAEAYFISCTAVRSADVIEALERDLGRPVITSNQAMLWAALRAAGIPDRLAGYGRLFRDF
jgi:maleate isomerase